MYVGLISHVPRMVFCLLTPLILKLSKWILHLTVLEYVLQKSCPHRMQFNYDHPVGCLLTAAFPTSVVVAVAESLLQKVKNRAGRKRVEPQLPTVRPFIMPYLQDLTQP